MMPYENRSKNGMKMKFFYLVYSRLTSTLVILLSLVGRYFVTDALPQLRSIADNKLDTRELLRPVPSNDPCDYAMIIPAIASGSKYTTRGVPIENATAEPNLSCYMTPPGTNKDVWYEFTPLTTSFYTFSTNLQNIQLDILPKRSWSCELSMMYDCQETRPTIDRILIQNTTYLIFLQPTLANVTGRLQLTVRNRKPPSNSQCKNATIIDPTAETFLSIRASNFAVPSLSISRISSCDVLPKFWYKITNPLTTPISVDITLTSNVVITPSYIVVLRGSNCSELQCVGGLIEYHRNFSYDFVAERLTSYYILVDNGSQRPFNVTIKGRASFFSVVDAEQDKAIKVLNGIDYFNGIRTSPENLNIQARFALPPASVKSVRLTYDNPTKVAVCDQKAPYSVFGDTHGDYNNATIPLGHHRITATPYAQSNCTGRSGATMVQDFRVTGCYTEYSLEYDNKYGIVYMAPYTSNQLSTRRFFGHTKLPVMLSLKCKVRLIVAAQCGFLVRSLKTEFRNATTNELILSKTELPVSGSSAHSYNLLDGAHIPVGSYSIRQIINNVTHPTMNFTVVKTNCK